jgi:hypothetical protein
VWHLLVTVITRQLYKTLIPTRSPASSQPFQDGRIRRRIVRFVVCCVVRPFAQFTTPRHGQAKRALQLVSMKAAWREALCAGMRMKTCRAF